LHIGTETVIDIKALKHVKVKFVLEELRCNYCKIHPESFHCSQNKSQDPTGLMGLLSMPTRRAKSISGMSLVRTQEAVPLCSDSS